MLTEMQTTFRSIYDLFGKILQRLQDFLFGYDYFISYSHQDGKAYPQSLYDAMTSAGYSVYLDSYENRIGDKISSITRTRIFYSKNLIVVGGPSAIRDSFWVRREVDIFVELNGFPIIIDLSNTIEGSRVTSNPIATNSLLDWLNHQALPENGTHSKDDILYVQDGSDGSLPNKIGAEALNQITIAYRGTRRELMRFRVVACVVVSLLLLIVFSSVISVLAINKREEASRSLLNELTSVAADSFEHQPIAGYKMLLSSMDSTTNLDELSRTQRLALSSMLTRTKVLAQYDLGKPLSCGSQQVFSLSNDRQRFAVSKNDTIEIVEISNFDISASEIVTNKSDDQECPYLSISWGVTDDTLILLDKFQNLIVIDSKNLQTIEVLKIPNDIVPLRLVRTEDIVALIAENAIYDYSNELFKKLVQLPEAATDWGVLIDFRYSPEHDALRLLWQFQLMSVDWTKKEIVCSEDTPTEFTGLEAFGSDVDGLLVTSKNDHPRAPTDPQSAQLFKIGNCKPNNSILDFSSDVEWAANTNLDQMFFVAINNFPASKLYSIKFNQFEEVKLPQMIFRDAIYLGIDHGAILLQTGHGQIYKIDASPDYFEKTDSTDTNNSNSRSENIRYAPYSNNFPEDCLAGDCFAYFEMSPDGRFLATTHVAPPSPVPRTNPGAGRIFVWDTVTRIKMMDLQAPYFIESFKFTEQGDRSILEVKSNSPTPILHRAFLPNTQGVTKRFLCDLLPDRSYGSPYDISVNERINLVQYSNVIALCKDQLN